MDIHIDKIGNLVHQKIPLVSQVVGHASRRLCTGNALVELDNLLQHLVELPHVQLDIGIIRLDLVLELARHRMHLVGKVLAPLQCSNPGTGIAGRSRQSLPRLIELRQDFLDALVHGVIEDGFQFVIFLRPGLVISHRGIL